MKRFIWTDISLRQLRQHYLKATGGIKSEFIEPEQALPAGVLGIRQHRMKG